MKKTILLTIALIFSATLFAQSRATFVNESFDGSSLPEGWTTSELGASNWMISSTNYSGGEGKELKLSWTPEFDGTTRLITTAFDLSGITDVNVSFKHLFDNFRDNDFYHTIGIATSTDGENWNIGWSQEYTITGIYEVNEVITTPDMGKENVMFCLFYDGNSHNMDNWFFDNLHIYKQTELDLRAISLDIPNIVEAGEKDISFTVENLGVKTINNIEVELNISEWESPVIKTFDVNMAHSEIIQLTFEDETFDAQARNLPYIISVKILSVNGTNDQDLSNNNLEKKVSVAYNKVQRVPMVEHFSSSTCGPCVAVNQQMHPLMLNNEGRYTYTKFPTAGDPYHTFEAAHRVKEYGVTGVPNIFLDGINKGSNYLTQEMLDERYDTPAYADIRGAFNVEGSTIKITADFMSYVKLDNVKAFITVNETTTEENIGSNGETVFHHILMKMLDSKEGNTISINAGKYHRFEFSYDMSKTHVEELNDLEVALWLQDPVTQEIYNSHFAYAYTNHCYPIQNLTSEQNGNDKIIKWEEPEQGNPKAYNVFIDGVLVQENTTDLSYSFTSSEDRFTVEVVALYNGGKTSVGVAKLFGYEEEIAAPEELAAAAKSTSSIELTWKAVENASSYNIYQDGELINNIVSQTTYLVEGLEYNTEYCFTVTAVGIENESEHSKKVCAKTLGESIEELAASVKIYPNPVEDKLYIDTDADFEIYNINGQQVYKTTRLQGEGQQSIDVSNLNAGIYFIEIKSEKGNIVKRFIKN